MVDILDEKKISTNVNDVWAVHFTDESGWGGGIIGLQGFKHGVTYSAKYYDTKQKIGQDSGYDHYAFLIKTDGVKTYHKGDKDEEIIFRGDMVKEYIPITYDEDYECWILYGDEYYDFDHYPKGAYWEEELGRLVFGDIYSLIDYVSNH